MTKEMIKSPRPERVMQLMCEILEFKETSEKKVLLAVETMGILDFFKNIENLDVDGDEKEKLRALKNIIEEKAKSICTEEGGH